QRVVGLAAEIEMALEKASHVIDTADAEVVELVRDQRVIVPVPAARPAREAGVLRVGPAAHHAAAVLREKVGELFEVEVARIVVAYAGGIALAAVAHESCIELARPGDAALEEGEVQIREALGHAAEDRRLGEGLAR